MRRKIVKTAVLGLLLLANPVLAGAPNGTQNTNWAGFAQTAGGYTSVQAEWRVPYCSYAPVFGAGFNKPVVSTWVGIGGVGNNQLIQIGTQCQMNNDGSVAYQVWFEEVPSGQVTVAIRNVKPGDLIIASATCLTNCTSNNAGQTWSLDMQNLTQNWTYSTGSLGYVTTLGSADIIAEALTYMGATYYQTFGDVSFQNILVNGANPSLQTTQEYYAHATSGETGNPSDPVAGGDGFKVCHGSGGAYTTCPATPTFTNDMGRGPEF